MFLLLLFVLSVGVELMILNKNVFEKKTHFLLLFISAGAVDTGNWTSYVKGLYQIGVTSVIAHFKIINMQVAMETKINVIPRAGSLIIYLVIHVLFKVNVCVGNL